MGSQDESVDVAYILAALVQEAGGLLTVSTEWFTSEEKSFEGKGLKLIESDGLIYITLEKGE